MTTGDDRPAAPLLPSDFEVPTELVTDHLVLRPLGPEHNEADHRAWTSSIAHIRGTPGFGGDGSWPVEGMTLDRNRRDLEMHADHFDRRIGFTYTVLDRAAPDDVIGCLYLYADPTGEHPVEARCWVKAARAELDGELREAVAAWLSSPAWPFASFRLDGLDGLDR